MNEGILNSKIIVSPTYNAQTNAFGKVDFPFLEKMIADNKINKILDVGTGDGTFICRLANRFPNVSIDAIDINRELIEFAKLNSCPTNNNVRFKNVLFGEDFNGKDYDLIIARFAIEHIRKIKDIDSFLSLAYKRLKPKGWLAIIEYYVHDLDITDPIWESFRKKELETYKKNEVHSRICLVLPELLNGVKFKSIQSSINQISPITIGNNDFYELVQEYVKLYSQLCPEIWPKEVIDQIMGWCKTRPTIYNPELFTSFTTGLKE